MVNDKHSPAPVGYGRKHIRPPLAARFAENSCIAVAQLVLTCHFIHADEPPLISYHRAVLFDKIRVIHDLTPRSAAVNMACDEVLLERVAVPTLRIYRWEKPAVSFGYFIRHTALATIAQGREIVRRMTGGGIVEHGNDLTYSLILPAAHPLAECPPRESYRAIHSAIATWLELRGIITRLSPTPAGGPANVCFESAAEFDLVAGAQKVAGAAQRRTRHGLLHQGSVQYHGVSEVDRAAFPAAFTTDGEMQALEPVSVFAAEELAARKYALSTWTERV